MGMAVAATAHCPKSKPFALGRRANSKVSRKRPPGLPVLTPRRRVAPSTALRSGVQQTFLKTASVRPTRARGRFLGASPLMPMPRAERKKATNQKVCSGFRNGAEYQPVPRSLNAAECLQGVPAGRTDKTVRLARGRMELGPLVKRAARAGDLRGCHRD